MSYTPVYPDRFARAPSLSTHVVSGARAPTPVSGLQRAFVSASGAAPCCGRSPRKGSCACVAQHGTISSPKVSRAPIPDCAAASSYGSSQPRISIAPTRHEADLRVAEPSSCSCPATGSKGDGPISPLATAVGPPPTKRFQLSKIARESPFQNPGVWASAVVPSTPKAFPQAARVEGTGSNVSRLVGRVAGQRPIELHQSQLPRTPAVTKPGLETGPFARPMQRPPVSDDRRVPIAGGASNYTYCWQTWDRPFARLYHDQYCFTCDCGVNPCAFYPSYDTCRRIADDAARMGHRALQQRIDEYELCVARRPRCEEARSGCHERMETAFEQCNYACGPRESCIVRRVAGGEIANVWCRDESDPEQRDRLVYSAADPDITTDDDPCTYRVRDEVTGYRYVPRTYCEGDSGYSPANYEGAVRRGDAFLSGTRRCYYGCYFTNLTIAGPRVQCSGGVFGRNPVPPGLRVLPPPLPPSLEP